MASYHSLTVIKKGCDIDNILKKINIKIEANKKKNRNYIVIRIPSPDDFGDNELKIIKKNTDYVKAEIHMDHCCFRPRFWLLLKF